MLYTGPLIGDISEAAAAAARCVRDRAEQREFGVEDSGRACACAGVRSPLLARVYRYRALQGGGSVCATGISREVVCPAGFASLLLVFGVYGSVRRFRSFRNARGFYCRQVCIIKR